MEKEIEYLKTTDLNLASTLLALGFVIDAMDLKGINSKQYEFYFKRTHDLEKSVTNYWDRTLKVVPLDIFSARRELLTRLKNEPKSS